MRRSSLSSWTPLSSTSLSSLSRIVSKENERRQNFYSRFRKMKTNIFITLRLNKYSISDQCLFFFRGIPRFSSSSSSSPFSFSSRDSVANPSSSLAEECIWLFANVKPAADVGGTNANGTFHKHETEDVLGKASIETNLQGPRTING